MKEEGDGRVTGTETASGTSRADQAPTPSPDGVGASSSEPKQGMRPIWLVLAFAACLGAGVFLVVVAAQGGDRQPKVWSYTVPPGTGARIEAGEKLYVFPARLDVHVGDQLVIRNDDVRLAQVGPYLVDRNSTLTQTFTSPGIIQGFCSIHPSGKVTIEVHE